MRKIELMIVDDHVVVREGLKQMLGLEDHMEIVGEAGSGLECLNLLETCSPDLILMDIRMPGINGIDTTRNILEKYPSVKVVMLTIYEEDEFIADAIKAGAVGYVIKKVSRDELIKIIHDVIEDHAFLDPLVAKKLFKSFKTKQNEETHGEEMTLRELEVLKCLVEGNSGRNIANSLFISEYTVRSHLKNIYRKLKVSSKSQAVAKAIHRGIITMDPNFRISG